MTCIIGYIDEEKNIWMGGDSAGCTANNVWTRSDEKIFIVDNMIYGFTSSFRMGQILRYSFKRPKQVNKDDYAYMCTSWIDKLRQCMKDKGFSNIKDNEETGGQFLVGYQGNLYQIDTDFQVGQHVLNYDAVGCGRDFALASMFTMESMLQGNMFPNVKIKIALASAEKFSAYVRGPFTIKCLNL